MSLSCWWHGEAVGGGCGILPRLRTSSGQGLERRLQWFATLVELVMILLLGGGVAAGAGRTLPIRRSTPAVR